MKKAVIWGVSILVLSLSACGSSSDKIQVTPTKTPTTVSSGATQTPVKDTSVDTSTVSSGTTKPDQDADNQKDTASSGAITPDTSVSTSTSSSTDTSSTGSVSLTDDDSANILKAFQDIYANKDPIAQSGMVLKTENLVDGKYFKGSVTVGSRDITNVFAIKRTDVWKVVSFGSDTPDCKWLSAFPADMSSGCLAAGSASGATSASGQVDASATWASFQ